MLLETGGFIYHNIQENTNVTKKIPTQQNQI